MVDVSANYQYCEDLSYVLHYSKVAARSRAVAAIERMLQGDTLEDDLWLSSVLLRVIALAVDFLIVICTAHRCSAVLQFLSW